ncbi:hypothetical protein HU200_040002 [Digitaria exilis]|uniref:Myb/SANT-like domain-containing protein n=1 Tax=Digitaria exilis TaxID=1010633 RepID=A0A835EHW4_9POAL|nr:hypothetical protein HU200_040002 [Digitaria exilis]
MSGDAARAAWNSTYEKAHFTKQPIQEKEKELKASYKAIRDAKAASGSGWNESLCMLILEPHVWDKLIKNHPKVAKFCKKPFPLFYQLEALYEGSVATGNLNFTSAQQVDSAPAPTAHVSVPAPAPTAPVPVQRSNSEQSTHNDHGYFGTNPFASCFDGQETSSAHEVQSAPSNQDSRQGEGGSGRKRNQSHIGSAIDDYVDFKKS